MAPSWPAVLRWAKWPSYTTVMVSKLRCEPGGESVGAICIGPTWSMSRYGLNYRMRGPGMGLVTSKPSPTGLLLPSTIWKIRRKVEVMAESQLRAGNGL